MIFDRDMTIFKFKLKNFTEMSRSAVVNVVVITPFPPVLSPGYRSARDHFIRNKHILGIIAFLSIKL
jgi:hypothetical protein